MTRPTPSTSDKIAKVARPPEVHVCGACNRPGASCGIGEAWFCPDCAPADFWPPESAGANPG